MFPSAQPKTNRSYIDDIVVGPLERRIEDGWGFEGLMTHSTGNAPNSTYSLFVTGDKAVRVAFRLVTTNGDEIVYQPLKGPTVTDNGTNVTSTNVVNMNGNNAKTGTVTLFEGATVSDDGTLIPRSYLPGQQGVGSSSSGSFLALELTRMLLPNTTYGLKITNSGAKTTATTDILLVWDEFDQTNATWR